MLVWKMKFLYLHRSPHIFTPLLLMQAVRILKINADAKIFFKPTSHSRPLSAGKINTVAKEPSNAKSQSNLLMHAEWRSDPNADRKFLQNVFLAPARAQHAANTSVPITVPYPVVCASAGCAGCSAMILKFSYLPKECRVLSNASQKNEHESRVHLHSERMLIIEVHFITGIVPSIVLCKGWTSISPPGRSPR